jgi:hypothetical protein
MPAHASSHTLIPSDRAHALADSLTEGDLEYLIRQTRANIRRERKRVKTFVPEPGKRDANQFKLERARDLEARLLAALGRDVTNPRGGGSGRA